jgi:hypothetical protein
LTSIRQRFDRSSRFGYCSGCYVHARAIPSGVAARLEVPSDAKSSRCWLRSITKIPLLTDHRAGINAGAFEQAVWSSRPMHVKERGRTVTQSTHAAIAIDIETSVAGAGLAGRRATAIHGWGQLLETVVSLSFMQCPV